ncbi:MAG: hypothetical protein GY924_09125 [Planctomycetaceae bacterium]|nr:hypothetical protein [Planctomycetaceae bacterium]
MMKQFCTLLGILIPMICVENVCQAQLPSVVQLPSFHTFSYRGSVLVPDGGTTSLGGVKRSATGYNHRGWNRGYGSVNSTSNASVSARIIDLAEMDRQILGGSPQEFLRRMRAEEQQAIATGLPVATTGRQTQATRSPAASTLSRTEEGKALVRFARQEYREGRKSSSIQAYGMAINQLDGRLKTLAVAEFRRVFGTAAEQLLQLSSLRR